MSYTRCLYLVTVVYCLSQPVLLTLVVFHPCVSPACAVLVISCVILFYFTLRLLAFAAIGLFTTILLSDPCSVIQSTSTVLFPEAPLTIKQRWQLLRGHRPGFACVCVRKCPSWFPLHMVSKQTNLMTTAKATTWKLKGAIHLGVKKEGPKCC